jgi:hypothetical protein
MSVAPSLSEQLWATEKYSVQINRIVCTPLKNFKDHLHLQRDQVLLARFEFSVNLEKV